MSSSFNTLVITFRWSQARTCPVMTRAPVQVCTVTAKSSQLMILIFRLLKRWFTAGNWPLWLWHNTMLANGKAFESQMCASHDQISRKPLIRILLHNTRKSMLYKKNKKTVSRQTARTNFHSLFFCSRRLFRFHSCGCHACDCGFHAC